MATTYTLTLPAGVTGGTFTLTAGGGKTGDINAPGTAGGIQAALRSVSGQDKAEVRGSNGGPYTITVEGTLTVDDTNLEGAKGITVAAAAGAPGTPGGPGAPAPQKRDYANLQRTKNSLLRKALTCTILVAPLDAPFPDKFFTGVDQFWDFFANGYETLGWVSKSDGVTFGRETESSDVESFGSTDPTRTDIIKDTHSSTFKAQETNKRVLSMYLNKNLDNVKVDKNGELTFDSDTIPQQRFYRVIFIGQDGSSDSPIFIIRAMPRATVKEVQEFAFSSESEINYGMTVQATRDETLGFSLRHAFGGSGFKAMAESMGFQLEP